MGAKKREQNLAVIFYFERPDHEEGRIAYAIYLIARGNYSDAEQVLSSVLALVPMLRNRHVQHEMPVLVLKALTIELSGDRALAAVTGKSM